MREGTRVHKTAGNRGWGDARGATVEPSIKQGKKPPGFVNMEEEEGKYELVVSIKNTWDPI